MFWDRMLSPAKKRCGLPHALTQWSAMLIFACRKQGRTARRGAVLSIGVERPQSAGRDGLRAPARGRAQAWVPACECRKPVAVGLRPAVVRIYGAPGAAVRVVNRCVRVARVSMSGHSDPESDRMARNGGAD